MTSMRRGWFRPDPGMRRVSDRDARRLDNAPIRPIEVIDRPEPMATLCPQCGERPPGRSGLCRECFLVRQIDRAIAADAPCRCGAQKSPLAMHCDACLVGRDRGVDYGDWSE